MVRRSLAIMVVLPCLLGLTGCSDECGDAICIDGLLLRVLDPSGVPADRYEGSIRTELSMLEFGCQGLVTTRGDLVNFQCLEQGEVLIFTPTSLSEVTLSVRNPEGDTFDEVVPLQFEAVFANGPECPPTCDQATVEVPLTPP